MLWSDIIPKLVIAVSLKYNCTIPENCFVSDQTKVDCNVVFKDMAEIENRNKQFIESEVKKKRS